MDHPESLAFRVGERLTEQAEDTGNGSKWAMNASAPLRYPNFSHGTAGVCYFLTRLFEETAEPRFLGAAVEGGQYLASLAGSSGLVFHHEPGGEELFYLGWCHGPAGTSLLFEQLEKLTGNGSWGATVRRSTRSIMASGIPQRQLPGFWNNVGHCCGSAGMGEFFLRLYQQGGGDAYLEFCEGITADIYDRADPETEGLKWVEAEHRVQPDFLQAQTGFAQGASGIGLWLLHLDGELQGRQPFVVLPDR